MLLALLVIILTTSTSSIIATDEKRIDEVKERLSVQASHSNSKLCFCSSTVELGNIAVDNFIGDCLKSMAIVEDSSNVDTLKLANLTLIIDYNLNTSIKGASFKETLTKNLMPQFSLLKDSLPCPPGLVQDEDNQTCSCFPDAYYGILSCNESNKDVYRSHGFWIGYDNTKQEANENTLLSGYCPPGFCSPNDSLLPTSANPENLSNIVCASSRTDVLCGKCRDGYSVFYHSLGFQCKRNRYCSWGWLFYILSEIVPVTIFFLIVVGLNVSFTSGTLNGFIFFSQVIETFQVTAGSFIHQSRAAAIFTRIHYLIYLFFNLETLVLDEVSYCIWPNSNALDILSFSYLTTIYAFILVLLVVLIMNKCSCHYFQNTTLQGSMIHGLSAFLVLSFAHSVRASILILLPTSIYGKGRVLNGTVAYYDGRTWMGVEHLPYAIPAILVLTLLTLPSLLLLIYPIHYKLLQALRISESSLVLKMLNPLEKMKPFLDSFQGCFKDNFRFFSGLYFVYRFLFLLNMATAKMETTYFFLSLQLCIMLVLHALCQPYKQRLHNVIDTLLFGNLALINAITTYNYSVFGSTKKLDKTIILTTSIQLVLIFLPFLVMLFCVCVRCFSYCKNSKLNVLKFKWKFARSSSQSSESLVSFSYGSIDRNRMKP